MGGSSKSSKNTSNTQVTNNIVNDGEFAGAGNVSLDESDRSINDSYNQTYELSEEYDFSNKDSNNTDNSIEVGDGIFAGGDVSILDGGAIDAAKEIATAALEESTKQNAAANALSQSAIDSNERTTKNALTTANHAITEVSDFADNSLETVGETSEKVIDSLTATSIGFAENLKAATETNFQSNESLVKSISDNSSSDKAVIAELAKNTSLAGQDIVAKSSEKMTMYMAVAMGVGFIAVAIIVARGK